MRIEGPIPISGLVMIVISTPKRIVFSRLGGSEDDARKKFEILRTCRKVLLYRSETSWRRKREENIRLRRLFENGK